MNVLTAPEPRIGPCHVCGAYGQLTFEHLPPRSLDNSERAELFDFFQAIAKLDGADPGPGRISQRGSGAFSLCRRCNERAGHRYVPELIGWSHAAWEMLRRVDLAEIERQLKSTYVQARLQRVRPGRLAKQIVTMLLAAAGSGFAMHHDHLALRDFAQDPDWTGLPDRYQLYLVLYTGEHVRMNGGAVFMRLNAPKLNSTFMLEIAAPPLAYILTVDEAEPPVKAGNITSFTELQADQAADVEIDLLVGFGHTPFPADFRSRAALDKCRADSLRRNASEKLWLPHGARDL